MNSEPPTGDDLALLLASVKHAVLQQTAPQTRPARVTKSHANRVFGTALAALLVLGLGTAGTALALNGVPDAAGPTIIDATSAPTEPSTTPVPTGDPLGPLPAVTPAPQPTVDPDASFLPGARPADIDSSDFTAVDPTPYSDAGSLYFNSPSRNLDCGITLAGMNDGSTRVMTGCALRSQEWVAPRDSADDYCYRAEIPCGRGIEVLGNASPHMRKRSDVAFSSEYSDTTLSLPYGSSVSWTGITCASSEEGIICENIESGHGFRISKSLHEMW